MPRVFSTALSRSRAASNSVFASAHRPTWPRTAALMNRFDAISCLSFSEVFTESALSNAARASVGWSRAFSRVPQAWSRAAPSAVPGNGFRASRWVFAAAKSPEVRSAWAWFTATCKTSVRSPAVPARAAAWTSAARASASFPRANWALATEFHAAAIPAS